MKTCQIVLSSEFASSKGAGAKTDPQIQYFLQNFLVKNYRAECTKINIGVSGV